MVRTVMRGSILLESEERATFRGLGGGGFGLDASDIQMRWRPRNMAVEE
jgi:hypothetical protein